jgi:alanyl-tRNA synthetase
MTMRLYHTEPWRREFEAEVVEMATTGSRTVVRLDRTAFYPTSGGQPFDTGTLGGARVVDVIDDEDAGEVLHVLDGIEPNVLAPGAKVRGIIDWDRRVDHMQQHTGQHLLSAALHRLHDVRTLSFHLGADVSTIDLAREVTSAEIASAEAAANRVVWENHPVSIRFVTAEEAERLPLRKEPVKAGRLRLVEVEGFDLSACGGTHVSRTGAVGVIAVRASERLRGGTRLTFVCGARALASYHALRDAVDAAARPLTVHPGELPAAVERLQSERKALQREAKALAERLAAHEAGEIAKRATHLGAVNAVVEALEGYDAAALKTVAATLVREPGLAAVLFSRTRPALVVAARSAEVTAIDCAALAKVLFARFGGKGGGRPDFAQGGGLDAASEELVTAAREEIAATPDRG